MCHRVIVAKHSFLRWEVYVVTNAGSVRSIGTGYWFRRVAIAEAKTLRRLLHAKLIIQK